jgi:hypothetical protein
VLMPSRELVVGIVIAYLISYRRKQVRGAHEGA